MAHRGVNFIDELFLTRCMVSPNKVETRVWIDYSKFNSINYSKKCWYMKKKMYLVSEKSI